jgi:hypothetical protein
MSTVPKPTARRKPRVSMSQAAGSATGMKRIMKSIAKRPTSSPETP